MYQLRLNSMNKRQETGAQGEHLARKFLEKQGMVLICANYACRWGELDLVMLEEQTLVFIEVKTRRSLRYGSALEAVTPQKQRRLWMSVRDYLLKHPHEGPVRFDVVGIHRQSGQEKIDYVRNALDAGAMI